MGMAQVSSRLQFLGDLSRQPFVRLLLALWAASGIWDLALSEWVPEEYSSHLPRVYQVIAMTTGFVSWQVWVVAGALILAFASLEYAVRRKDISTPMRRVTTARSWQMWLVGGALIGAILLVGCSIALILDSRSTNAEIQSALRRYVLPRHLSDKQIKRIVDTLKGAPVFNNVKLTAVNYEEARSYAYDIRSALISAGWPCGLVSTDDNVPEGVNVTWQLTEDTNRQYQELSQKGGRAPPQALQEALSGITNGYGSGQAPSGDTVTIRIGNRRMDDGDLRGKQRLRERAMRMLKESNDDE